MSVIPTVFGVERVTPFANLPGDHWKTLGAEMQKYLGDQCTREELEASIESYWQKQ